MDDGTIWEILKNIHLLLKQLAYFFALQEIVLGLLLSLIWADVNHWLSEYCEEDVVHKELLVFVKDVNLLNRAIYEHLETHLEPVNVHEQEAKGKS